MPVAVRIDQITFSDPPATRPSSTHEFAPRFATAKISIDWLEAGAPQTLSLRLTRPYLNMDRLFADLRKSLQELALGISDGVDGVQA